MANNEQTVWYECAKGEYPPPQVEVLAGFWYEDPWLKNPWRFLQGMCFMFESDHPSFASSNGLQWHTFGPAHSQITHWCYPPTPPERK